MLILTGITINLLFGDNGIITKTKMAKKAFLGEDAKQVVEDRVNAYIAEYGSKGELDLFDFWAMYNSSELLDASGNSTGQDNPNYDKNFVIYLFEDVGVTFTPPMKTYTKGEPYTSAVVIYKGYQATVNKNFTVAKTVREVTKLEDISPEGAHKLENDEIPGGSKWDSTMGVQTPSLSEGMVPVRYDGTNWVVCSSENTNNEWYNYSGSTETSGTDYTASQWANIMLMDGLTVYNSGTSGSTTTVTESNKTQSSVVGHNVATMGSMFVWIPRYEYSISGTTITVNFIPMGTDGYTNTNGIYEKEGKKIHPAFTNDTANGYINGGWSSDLPGIWVAKFEASNSSSKVKVVPGVTSWRNITIGNMFTYCRNITGSNAENYGLIADDESGIENASGKTYAHLMKNSEWGAVAYLTHSKYGRNGVEIYPNPDSSYITGKAGTSTSARNVASGNCYAYDNTTYGVKASTTGNVYGIYDMSGGAWEYVAAYNNTDSHNYESENGASFATKSNTNNSTKYATWYANGSTSTFTSSSHAGNKVGDATYETADLNRNYNACAYEDYPFFGRGGYHDYDNKAGIFGSRNPAGSQQDKERFPPSACGGEFIINT